MSSKSNGARVAMAERTNLARPPRGAGRKRGRAETDLEAAALPKAAKAESGGYAHGAICRLRLHNFLTFDDVILTPNPQLNVIVGPNGTGKSSIVCAMCLGLGGHPRLLGRAKEIKDFIKHGKEVGFVEVTLHNERGRDPIIRRTMKNQDNSSSWTLNGRQVLQREVVKAVQEMNIQLDNRCQFLPQDMVVEFAKMNSFQLLEETEKAIGDKDMYESHMKLKSLKSGTQDKQRLLESREQELAEELRKNQLLERDVERFQNRQEYMKTIRQLKMKKLWVEYEDCRSEFLSAKEQRKEAERKLRSVKHNYHPIITKRKEQEEAVARFKMAEQEKATEFRQKERRVTAMMAELTSLEDELDSPRQELESRKKEEHTRRKNVERLRKEIQSYKSELDKLQPQESIQPRIAEKNARMRVIQREIGKIGTEQQDLQMERQQHTDQIRRANDELRQMQDIRNQRLQFIRGRDGRDSGTYQAVMWLKDNQHRFKQPILEPIALVVNIRDQRYAPQIEASLRGKDFFSFVAQNQEDQDAFLAEFKTRRKVKVNIVRAPPRPLSDFRPEVPLERLRPYGFQRMLIDLIEAPDPILRYFCQYHGLHTIAIAGDLSPPQIERVIREQKGLRRFFTSKSQYMVTKSRYADKSSVRNSDIRPAQALVASVDSLRKAELEREIREAQQSLAVFDSQYQKLEARDTELRQEDNRLRQEKNDLRKITDNRRKLQSNITTRETKLEQQLSSSFDLQAEEERCEQAVEKIQRKRVKCIENLRKLLQECVTARVEKVHIGLFRRNSEMRVGFLLNQYHQAKTALENAEQEVLTHKSQEDSRKAAAQQLLRKAKDESGVEDPKHDPALIGAFQNYPGEVDAIEEMIHEYQAQAEMCMGTDESVVTEFEQRNTRIEALQEETEQLRSALKNQGEKIDKLKERWLAPLQKLIDDVISKRFQESFKHMGCIGDVTLQQHEDFSKYAIQIRVKFRDSEELQVLDAQRQSGGERSVSTMLYLMALQGITSCPFRVVDEINQGMDPVNERRVFDLIVKTASQQGTAQYFLLTPKLLQNLSYSEAVTVHVVHNGQEMVPFRHWNMTSFLG